jgi:hypothetical protein
MRRRSLPLVIAFLLAGAFTASSQAPNQAPHQTPDQTTNQPTNQPPYQPKFKGDPAHSDAEAAALGYMRTVLGAERDFKKRRGQYAPTLVALVGKGSFTRRMTNPDRGDYTVSFRGKSGDKSEGFALVLTPKQFDAAHRAFYVDEKGQFRVEDDKAATASSPPLK